MPEGGTNHRFVGPVAIGAELDAVRHPTGEVGQEDLGVVLGALADDPRGEELRVCADRRMGPHVAVAGSAFELLGHVLLLRITEGPDLIDLHHLAGEVLEDAVLVVGAGFAEVHQELGNRVLRRPRHAHGGPDAVALH